MPSIPLAEARGTEGSNLVSSASEFVATACLPRRQRGLCPPSGSQISDTTPEQVTCCSPAVAPEALAARAKLPDWRRFSSSWFSWAAVVPLIADGEWAPSPLWCVETRPSRCVGGIADVVAGGIPGWLNAVEGFFAKLTRRRLNRGVFKGVADLQVAINRVLRETNDDPKPFL